MFRSIGTWNCSTSDIMWSHVLQQLFEQWLVKGSLLTIMYYILNTHRDFLFLGLKESTCLVCRMPCSIMKLVPDVSKKY